MYSLDNNQFWSPREGSNLVEGKEEWKEILVNLRILKNMVSAKAHKYHRELFFNGRLHSDLLVKGGPEYSKLIGLRIFEDKLLWHMWYHPEPSVDMFAEILDAEKTSSAAYYLRRFFFVDSHDSRFKNLYGLMGGREKLIVKALLPSLDWSSTKKYTDKEYSLGLHPSIVIGRCPGATKNVLKAEITRNPYSPGQYLWGHLDFSLEEYPELCQESQFYGDLMLVAMQAMRSVMDFYDRDGGHQSREPSILLQAELKDRFEANDFGKTLTSMWLAEKSRYEAGEPTPEEYEE